MELNNEEYKRLSQILSSIKLNENSIKVITERKEEVIESNVRMNNLPQGYYPFVFSVGNMGIPMTYRSLLRMSDLAVKCLEQENNIEKAELRKSFNVNILDDKQVEEVNLDDYYPTIEELKELNTPQKTDKLNLEEMVYEFEKRITALNSEVMTKFFNKEESEEVLREKDQFIKSFILSLSHLINE